MRYLQDIYDAIAADGFIEPTIRIIDELINDIENGTTDFPRFNQQEHSGLCKAGPALIGASIIASYATRSLTTSGDAASRQGCPPSWQLDELQPFPRCDSMHTKPPLAFKKIWEETD